MSKHLEDATASDRRLTVAVRGSLSDELNISTTIGTMALARQRAAEEVPTCSALLYSAVLCCNTPGEQHLAMRSPCTAACPVAVHCSDHSYDILSTEEARFPRMQAVYRPYTGRIQAVYRPYVRPYAGRMSCGGGLSPVAPPLSPWGMTRLGGLRID